MYTPITGSTILHSLDSINRPFQNPSQSKLRCSAILEDINKSLRPEAMEMVAQFSAERHRAQEALILGQYFQKRACNKGRLALEFSEGDLVLLSLHSLSLLKSEKGRGRKLLMKYDGPFEVIQKLSPVFIGYGCQLLMVFIQLSILLTWRIINLHLPNLVIELLKI